MLFPANPLPHGSTGHMPNNYVSPTRGATPTGDGSLNAMKLGRESMVLEQDNSELRKQEESYKTEERRRLRENKEKPKECQTCKNRRYQDESNDASVSFQSPTQLDPGEAEAAVRAHERQHVSHEQQRAEEKGREVVSQTVTIHYAICPECGRTYVAGGTTRTTTRAKTPEEERLAMQYGAGIDVARKGLTLDSDG